MNGCEARLGGCCPLLRERRPPSQPHHPHLLRPTPTPAPPPHQLGTKAGAEEIKSHPFFEGVNFSLIRQQRPPYVPRKAAAPGGNGSAADGGGGGGAKGGGFENF
jgi:hypothetical protein